MPIKRSTYQSDESLEDFYKSRDWQGAFAAAAAKMLTFIAWINEVFQETELVAFTSHQRLCIQDKDDDKLNGVVIISQFGTGEYFIEYRVPEHKSPWKRANMTGTAWGFEEAKEYFIRAMIETECWEGNQEIEKYLQN